MIDFPSPPTLFEYKDRFYLLVTEYKSAESGDMPGLRIHVIPDERHNYECPEKDYPAYQRILSTLCKKLPEKLHDDFTVESSGYEIVLEPKKQNDMPAIEILERKLLSFENEMQVFLGETLAEVKQEDLPLQEDPTIAIKKPGLRQSRLRLYNATPSLN